MAFFSRFLVSVFWFFAPALFLAGTVAAQQQDTTFTVVLEGGTIYDGSDNAPFTADVGVVGDRIAAVGDLAGRPAERRLDVRGLAVAPGFIDIHSHADGGILARPLAENYLHQGVTTAMGGQDGGSPYPVGDFLRRLDAEPAAINFGLFVGHGTVRARVMGGANRAPTEADLVQMQDLVERALKEGAFGLSAGLEYTPGAYAETDELIALAQVIAPYDGLYIAHIRDEGGRLLESVEETIRVGEAAGVATQVTHHKVVGPDRWGQSAASLALIDSARARGVDAASDVYPYAVSSTGLAIIFPDWSLEGDAEARQARWSDAATREKLQAEIAEHLNEERGGDPGTIVMANCGWDASLNGQSLADILEERGRPVDLKEAAALAIELEEAGGCQVVLHSMSEADVRQIMQHPWTMIASDGGIPALGQGVPHPRNYGAFARVLGHYVRQDGVLSMEEAIRKMTSLPAQRLGLKDRGTLRPGTIADVVVFEPAAVTDHATFAEPHQYATGVVHVFVAGEAVLLGGEVTGARPGHALRHVAIDD